VTKASVEVDSFAANLLRRSKIPGLSLTVVQHGRPVVARGYGFRNREARLPATARTVYGIASVTKSFTALAILRLEELGALSVRDPVNRHLPEFQTPEARSTSRIQIHHFLTHSSGLPPLPSIYHASARSLALDPPYDPRVARRVGIDPDHAPIDTYEQILEYLRTTPYRLLGPPGRQFSYSNEGFGLLGAIVERASGRTYENFLEEEVLRPAGMRSTTFDTGVMRRSPEVTTLYSPKWAGPRHGLVASDTWWEDTCLRAAGGLRTNVEDLSRYLEIYLNGGKVGRERVLAAASIGKMLRPYIGILPGLFYGYGVAVRPDYHGRLLAVHDGGLKGVSSQFIVVPSKHLGGAVLANADQAPSSRLLQAAINQRLGLPMSTPLVDLPAPAPPGRPLREYAGWFCSGEGIWARVTPSGGALRFDFHGIEEISKGLRFAPVGNDAFVLRLKGTKTYIRFYRDRRGRVESVFLGWRRVRRRDPRELPRARKGTLAW
jgi:CubicO group peptidase (beta-lactamase class C family)